MGLFLVGMGVNVILAKDAVVGLEAVKNHGPDLVLTDIQMPETEGFALLCEIRGLGPNAGGNVPVVALTGLDMRTERAHPQYGISGVLAKALHRRKVGGDYAVAA